MFSWWILGRPLIAFQLRTRNVDSNGLPPSLVSKLSFSLCVSYYLINYRFLELQSSGRKDEIRLHYTHLGLPKVEVFNYRLADGAWHRIALTVSGGVADLYIDCRRVERRWMAGSPDTSMPPTMQQQQKQKDNSDDNKMSLWIGQRGVQHFLFKVILHF